MDILHINLEKLFEKCFQWKIIFKFFKADFSSLAMFKHDIDIYNIVDSHTFINSLHNLSASVYIFISQLHISNLLLVKFILQLLDFFLLLILVFRIFIYACNQIVLYEIDVWLDFLQSKYALDAWQVKDRQINVYDFHFISWHLLRLQNINNIKPQFHMKHPGILRMLVYLKVR